MLTGESKNASKHPDVIEKENIDLIDRKNLLYSGTLVSKGKGIGIVFATGMDTEMGEI